MRNVMIAALGAALVLSPVCAGAQSTPAAPPPAPPPPYGMSIGFEAAKKAIAAAEAEAKKNNWPVAIAIVDTGGHLVAFSRIDNTQIGSIDIALGKARTANNLKRPTKALQDGIAQGGANLCACSRSRTSCLWKAACRS
jgi:hypothetical protein